MAVLALSQTDSYEQLIGRNAPTAEGRPTSAPLAGGKLRMTRIARMLRMCAELVLGVPGVHKRELWLPYFYKRIHLFTRCIC